MLVPTLAGAALALALSLPLAWKWELGVRRVAFSVDRVSRCSRPASWRCSTASWPISPPSSARCWWPASRSTFAFAILAYRFYRDPQRTPPAVDDDVVISPADGEVIYVRRSEGGKLPRATKKGRDYDLVELTKTPLKHDDAVVIGIAMSFLDVHVNRAPIAGRVRLRQHFPGRFGSLGRPEMVYENERATTVIERGDMEIAMVQIASRLVRQIASYVKVGEDVSLGQRVGVIRLGSQVDVVLPVRPDVVVNVQPGQRVRAGESVLAVVTSEYAAASLTRRAHTARRCRHRLGRAGGCAPRAVGALQGDAEVAGRRPARQARRVGVQVQEDAATSGASSAAARRASSARRAAARCCATASRAPA